MDPAPNPPRITVATGELRTHRLILTRIGQAIQARDFSLMVIFPTLSLLNHIRDEFLQQTGIKGIGGIRFLLFEGFIDEVGGRFGLNSRQPSALERNLLVARAFRKLAAQGKLDYLNRAPFTAGYRQAILQGIAEWKRGRLTPEIFGEWAAGRDEKQRQLALLYQNYQNMLIEYGYNEADLILDGLESKREGLRAVRKTPVLLYGFTDVTPLQNAFINTLTGLFDFEIMLDPTKVAGFRELSARFFKFAAGAGHNFEEIDDAKDEPTACNPINGLHLLQDRFWTEEPGIIPLEPDDDSVKLLQTSGLIRQATGIAREISGLLKADPEITPADFLILAPEPQSLLQTARPVFEEYRIPLAGQTTPVDESVWVNEVFGMLAAAGNDWQWPDLEVLVRKFYKGDAPAGDRLLLMISERYGALSGRERWLKLINSDSFRQYCAENGFNLERLFQGLGRLAVIPKRAFLKDYLRLMKDLITGQLCPPREILAETGLFSKESGGDFGETVTTWVFNYRAVQLVNRSLDEWLALLEKQPERQEMEVSEFYSAACDFLLARTGLAVEPPAAGRPVIRILAPREARGLKSRIVFITGLEKGVFPRDYVNDWKVDARGRFELKKRGIELETGAHYFIQERLAFYWALQSAATKLYLVYQDQDADGQPLNRSVFLDEVLEWMPELANRRLYYPLAPGLPESPAQCHSLSEVRGYWAGFLGQDPAQFPADRRAYCEALLASASYRQLLGRIHGYKLRRAGITAQLFKNPAVFKFIAGMFNTAYVFAITALEDYRSCPYRFFLKHVLKARPVPKPEFTPSALELGSLYHRILESFCDNYRDTCLQPGEAARYERQMEECFKNHYREWQEAAANDLVKLMLLLEQNSIRRNLKLWLDAELKWAAGTGGRFAIKYLELAFGLAKGDFDAASVSDPCRLNDGPDQVKLWGKIDRVDADSLGNFVIYDYKSGRGSSSKEILKRNYLQLPIYILALEQLLFGAQTAAGGSYLGLKSVSRIRCGVWRSRKMAGLADEDGAAVMLEEQEWQNWLDGVQNIIINIVRAIRHGEFHMAGEECLPYCEYKDICRREGWEVDISNELSAQSRTG